MIDDSTPEARHALMLKFLKATELINEIAMDQALGQEEADWRSGAFEEEDEDNGDGLVDTTEDL